MERVKRDLKENEYQGGNTKYMLPDMKQIQVTRDSGYNRDALAYLYFNSSIVKDMETAVPRSNTSKMREDQQALMRPLDKMRLTGL